MIVSGRLSPDTAHYRIGPLTTYVDPAELERAFRRANAGERVTYAIGPSLSPSATARLMVARWQEQGLCHMARHREGTGWRYFIEKRPNAAASANEVSEGRSISGRPEHQLLLVLVDIAEAGRALPSLDLLADRAELPHRQAADYRLRLLVEGGFIRLRREGVNRFADILKREGDL